MHGNNMAKRQNPNASREIVAHKVTWAAVEKNIKRILMEMGTDLIMTIF